MPIGYVRFLGYNCSAEMQQDEEINKMNK
jgi:hypothetical protein